MEDLLRARLLAARLVRWLRGREAESEPGREPEAAALGVDALVADLGLDVATFPAAAHPGTLGYLEPGEDLIFLRDGLPEPVRRFTLAHELGHAVLHRATGAAATIAGSLTGPGAPALPLDECDSADLEAPLDLLGDETLRPGQAYSARARRESEANAFAAALLLPADRVRAAYFDAGRGEATARTLAERFVVSEDVALRRLAALLLPGEDQVEEAAAAPPSEAASGAEVARAPLDPNQQAAAEASPPALIIAGPGTGKTSTLVGRVARLVREEGVAPGAILALTFSNKAAREMRERVGRLLAASPASADPAALLAPQPLPAISTIHAFCGDLLRRYAPRVGLRPDFRLITATEGYFLLRRLSRELELEHYQPLTAPALYFPDLLAAISRAKDELADPPRYAGLAEAMRAAAQTDEEALAAARVGEVARVYAAYQRALEARGDPDFGDVIRLAVRLLQEHPDVLAQVRARYAHILVDEFQDINRAMGVLLRTLAGEGGPLWAVGDPDQAIYRFRGASPANIGQFEADYPHAKVRRLTRNYRSYRPILEAAAGVAATFIPNGTGAERPPLTATRGLPATSQVTLAISADEATELAGLTTAIRERRARGRALLDLAVLCRTRRGAQRVVAALHRAGIPTRVVAPLLEQRDVKDLLAVASLLAEPSGAGLLRAGAIADHAYSRADARRVLDAAHARQVSPLALLARDGEGLRDVAGLAPAEREALARLGAILAELRHAPDVATGLARYAFSLTGVGRRALAGVAADDPVERERAVHLARLLTLARAFEDQRRGAQDGEATASSPRGAAWGEFIEYVRVLVALRQEAGGSSDELLASADDGVWVLTVHASKGLEFPVVYLPGLAERRFPVQKQYEATPPPPGLAEQGGGEEAHIAEEACLFYVALTRARDELVLSVAERYGRTRARPSRFLAPIEARLGERLARARWVGAPAAPGEPLPEAGDAEDEARAAEVASGASADEPLSVSALETYQRCPRQYAYHYVYGLRPEGSGLVALSRGLREALRELRERFDGATEADTAPAGAPTLAEAHAFFERYYVEASSSPRDDDADPYEPVYRRYGRQIVERAWHELAGELAAVGERAGDAERRPTADARDFERQMTVQVGDRAVSLTVDRVERAREPDVDGAGESGTRDDAARGESIESDAQPTRFVRHRLGRAAERPDLRALLYTLAAEQRAGRGKPAEVAQAHLPSGRVERVKISEKQLASLRDELDGLLAGIARGEYPARPEPHKCQGCPFLLICPA